MLQLEHAMMNYQEKWIDTLGGKQRNVFVPWIRDHVHVMKAMKYLHPDMTSFIEFFLENQTSEGINVFNTELYINDKLVESPKLPASFTTRRYELCWKYDLPKGKYAVRLKILNPSKDEQIRALEAIVYSNQPSDRGD